MRTADIINHLVVELPKRANDFTDSINLSSVTVAANVATATTPTAHGLAIGQQVNIVGVQVPIEGTISRVGTIATIETDSDHDLTEGAGFDVQIANSTGYDGTFTLLNVPDRRVINFQVAGTEPLTDTGELLNGSNVFNSYNGVHTVTAVTATTFDYVLNKDLADGVGGAIKGNPRISGATTFETLLANYTKQQPDKAWLFAVMGDGIAHKDRNTDTDSTANITRGANYNQRLSQSVTLFLFLPTSQRLTGRMARDRCEELLSPICQSMLTAKFPTLMTADNNPLMFVSHGFEAYNSAFYVHQYTFEATIQLTNSDVFTPDCDVAFRQLDFTMCVIPNGGEIGGELSIDGSKYQTLLTELGDDFLTEDGLNLEIEGGAS